MKSRGFLLTVFVFGIFSLVSAYAADPFLADPENYELRIEFIEQRLNENMRHSRYWQNGWTSFFAASAVAQTAFWIDADNNDDRINYSINTIKSIGAMVDMLLRPHPGRLGADSLLCLPNNTTEEKYRRIAIGESILRDSAARAESRYAWQPHVKVGGVNLIAGALIAAFGDKGDALTSTVLGIAIGEANIWTQPIRPEEDWREYQKRFPLTQSSEISDWQLVPIVGGVALKVTF